MTLNAAWDKYKGKDFLYVDYGACESCGEMMALLEKEIEMLRQAGGKSLILANFSGATVEGSFITHAKKLGKIFEEHTAKAAILGIHGTHRMLLRAYNNIVPWGNKIEPFDDKTSAMEYLVN